VQEKVYQCAAGLISLGIQKGDLISLLSEGRNDWVISSLPAVNWTNSFPIAGFLLPFQSLAKDLPKITSS
jgi:hypothetical protein